VSFTIKDINVFSIYAGQNVREPVLMSAEKSLVDSIKTVGLLQPICVYAVEKGTTFEDVQGKSATFKFGCVYGHRRLSVFRELSFKGDAKFDKIPAIVIEKKDIVFLQLIENMERKPLTAFELFQAIAFLRKQKVPIKKMSKMLNFSHDYMKHLSSVIPKVENDPAQIRALKSEAATLFDLTLLNRETDEKRKSELLEKRTKREITKDELQQSVRKQVKDLDSEPVGIPDLVHGMEPGMDQNRKPTYAELETGYKLLKKNFERLRRDSARVEKAFDQERKALNREDRALRSEYEKYKKVVFKEYERLYDKHKRLETSIDTLIKVYVNLGELKKGSGNDRLISFVHELKNDIARNNKILVREPKDFVHL
jgi:ParB-like chromosome segregation protein Spo0J